MHYLQQFFPKTAFSTSFILDNAEALDCNDIQSLIYIKTILLNLQHYSWSKYRKSRNKSYYVYQVRFLIIWKFTSQQQIIVYICLGNRCYLFFNVLLKHFFGRRNISQSIFEKSAYKVSTLKHQAPFLVKRYII